MNRFKGHNSKADELSQEGSITNLCAQHVKFLRAEEIGQWFKGLAALAKEQVRFSADAPWAVHDHLQLQLQGT